MRQQPGPRRPENRDSRRRPEGKWIPISTKPRSSMVKKNPAPSDRNSGPSLRFAGMPEGAERRNIPSASVVPSNLPPGSERLTPGIPFFV